MISRFVVVPAIPTETGSIRNGSRFYCQTAPIGFNIYDNEEKLRLQTTSLWLTAFPIRQRATRCPVPSDSDADG